MRTGLKIGLLAILAVLMLLGGLPVHAAEEVMPIVFQEDFEGDGALEKWEFMDPEAWKIATEEEGGKKVLAMFQKSKYIPKVRSPRNYGLIKDLVVGDFVMDLQMQSTTKDYGHRDLCLFFGHQDKSHFYYVHMALKADPHAHSVFLVNGKPRRSIAKERTKGLVWSDKWHNVRLVRKVESGTVEVYFDDMDKPIMIAEDKTFTWGRIGVGAFDDIGNFDNIVIRGIKVAPGKK